MLIEISDPSAMDSLRAHLLRNGCPSERRTEDTLEVLVFRASGDPLTDSQVRTTVFGHVRDWCADNTGVKANLLS